jgi:hypothetical protein
LCCFFSLSLSVELLNCAMPKAKIEEVYDTMISITWYD